MFHIQQELRLGMSEDRALWDAPSVLRCLHVLCAVCAPSSAEQAQELLHRVISHALNNVESASKPPWTYAYAYHSRPLLSLPGGQS